MIFIISIFSSAFAEDQGSTDSWTDWLSFITCWSMVQIVLFVKRLINQLWLHLQLVYRISLIKLRTGHVGILDLTKKELLVPLNNVLEVVTHWHMHCKFVITDLSSIILKRSQSNGAVKGTFISRRKLLKYFFKLKHQKEVEWRRSFVSWENWEIDFIWSRCLA